MQHDPLGYLDGLNLYEYLHSVPLDFIDPLGLLPPGGGGNPGQDFHNNYEQRARRAQELGLTMQQLAFIEWQETKYGFEYDPSKDHINIGHKVAELLKAELLKQNAYWEAFEEFMHEMFALTWAQYKEWEERQKQGYTRVHGALMRKKYGKAKYDKFLEELRKIWPRTKKGKDWVEGPQWPLCCFVQSAICTEIEKCKPQCCDHYRGECLKGGNNACHGGQRPGSPPPPPGCPKASCCFTGREN